MGKGGAGLTDAQPERFESVSGGFGTVVTAAQPAFLNPTAFVSFVVPVSFSGARPGAEPAATGFAILMPCALASFLSSFSSLFRSFSLRFSSSSWLTKRALACMSLKRALWWWA